MKISKLLAIIIMLGLFCNSAAGMDFDDSGVINLFSRMSGTVYIDGVPAANAMLVRTVNFGGVERDRFEADEQGQFELPAMYEANLDQINPEDLVVGQEVIVEYQGRRYPLWSAAKRNPQENSEARGGELEVECDLAGLNQLVQIDGQPIFTPCRWNVQPDVFTPGFH